MTKNKPLYKVVYNKLLSDIKLGKYSENEMLPSETELMADNEVSRITVRRALTELELAGYVVKIHGKGTIVRKQKPYSNLVGASSFSQEAMKAGESPSSVILDFKEVAIDEPISEYLQLPVGSIVYYLKRLRLRNGRIIGLNETYISKESGFKFLEEVNEHTSLYGLYEKSNIEIGRATETIEALMPTVEVKRELYMSDGEPIFKRERITYSTNNDPIEYSNNIYKANEYKYVIELKHE